MLKKIGILILLALPFLVCYFGFNYEINNANLYPLHVIYALKLRGQVFNGLALTYFLIFIVGALIYVIYFIKSVEEKHSRKNFLTVLLSALLLSVISLVYITSVNVGRTYSSALMSEMSNLQPQAIIDFDNNHTYEGFCSSDYSTEASVKKIVADTGIFNAYTNCAATTSKWAFGVSGDVILPGFQTWCVDSSGYAGTTTINNIKAITETYQCK